jgi:hypothetical protein
VELASYAVTQVRAEACAPYVAVSHMAVPSVRAPSPLAPRTLLFFHLAQTLGWCSSMGLACILFEAYQEPWKAETEGLIGPYWGKEEYGALRCEWCEACGL